MIAGISPLLRSALPLIVLGQVPGAAAGVVYPVKRLQPATSVCFGTARQSVELRGYSRKRIERLAQMVGRAFLDEPFTEEEKRIIEQALNQEFSISRTGVEFRGFRECTAPVAPGTVIIYPGWRSMNEGVAESLAKIPVVQIRPVLGLSERGKLPQDMAGRPVALRDQLAEIAMHEFGHIAGLSHERNRSDSEYAAYTAPDPQSLMNHRYLFGGIFRFGLIGKFTREELKLVKHEGSDHFVPRADPNQEQSERRAWLRSLVDTDLSDVRVDSAGTYRYRVRLGLSKGDVHTLRCHYRDRTGVDPRDCHAGFDPYRSQRR